MRMSCNGCRVLRKGCSHTCSIRPCLQWIKSSDSQANATVFLAKFYGRAGLINLLNAGPDHLRPAIFRSLLYEACGRIVNPVYGSAGLLSSGEWRLTQEAVESVLKGTPINQIPADTVAADPTPPLAYDIRHICRESSASADLHKVNKPRSRFKRSGAAKSAPRQATPPFRHESAGSGGVDGQCLRQEEEEESTTSAETGEEAASHVSQGEPGPTDEVVLGLELTLGFQPVSMSSRSERAAARTLCDMSGWDADGGAAGLGLGLPASF